MWKSRWNLCIIDTKKLKHEGKIDNELANTRWLGKTLHGGKSTMNSRMCTYELHYRTINSIVLLY
jgi:hypothetical protein